MGKVQSNTTCNVIILNGNFYRCARDLVGQKKQKHFILYRLPYNKKVFNLMMVNIKAETCSC